MFTGGSIAKLPVGTVISWDRDGFPDCGRIDCVGSYYVVRNAKGEQRVVNFNDRSIRVRSRPDVNLYVAVPLTSFDEWVNDTWFSWKANK